jgi:hypothetical protein
MFASERDQALGERVYVAAENVNAHRREREYSVAAQITATRRSWAEACGAEGRGAGWNGWRWRGQPPAILLGAIV